ncbi:MAG: aromatic ring-opening dioxygenase LigA [Frankiales bacterium]|nr:aromatic ring-opening dioxygenase LigA [Frankiales bacterium]
MRARDALGRPVAADSPDAVEPVAEAPLPPYDAVAVGRSLLAAGRAFSAHEVFEASWKAAPAAERDLWQGLAQVCVGVTHLQRGNRVGAVRLLRRGAGLLAGREAAYGVDAPRVASEALRLAADIEAGREPETLTV